ncbi:sodium:solute symporter [Halalkalicoccus sp. NIPERK01]|uniref:sodium:solute symporter family protein n=1 Tax=Halalkalicoccus sp. NIPERK01 TaxID=3053469 RepID=UPI00256F556B|nr:sodium:solute symporter family protein [Halalkalicoccus sp. NIPERK01]MDL5361874.1 sodium:solute symporter family protein [Halalkalicoccus sp. NIPERK01]
MVERTLIVTAVPLAYLVVALGIGLWSRGKADQNTTEGYIAGDRNVSLVVLYFIMGASILSAFAFLGGPGAAYSDGGEAYYVLAYTGTGMLLWYLLGPKAIRLGRKYGYVTQAEMVSDRYDSKWLSVLMALASIGAFIPYTVLQITGVGLILETASDGLIPYWLAALLPFLVITVYVLSSGMMGVGWSNVLQGAMMLVFAWSIGLYLPFELYGGVGPMFEGINAELANHLVIGGTADGMSVLQYSSYVLVSTLGFVMWPHLFMRAYTSRDVKTLKKTVMLYPLFGLVLVPILFIGFSGIRYAEVANPDNILPYMLTTLEMNPWIIGFFFAGGLAAAMSSADSIVHAAASVFTRDFYTKVIEPDAPDRRATRITQLAVVAVVAVSYYFAVVSSVGIVDLLAGAYGAVIQFLPLVLGAIYWEQATREGAITALLAGSAVTVYYTFFAASPLLVHAGFWGLCVTTVVFVAVSLFTEVDDPKRVREFIEATRPQGEAVEKERSAGEAVPADD